MDTLYRDNILDHYHDPRCFGRLQEADASEAADNPLCGDSLGMEIKVQHTDEKEKIIGDIAFFGDGCAISIASASLLCEHVKGMSVSNAQQIASDTIYGLLGVTLTPARTKCALLSLELLHRLLAKIENHTV